MKMSVSSCLFIIFSVQLLITSTLSVENKLSPSTPDTNLVHHAATTVADIDPQEDNSKARADDEVKNMIGISKKSQGGKIGSGGGNNVVHGEKKNDAASTTLPQK
ncbi:hypothetical protein POM88_044543 [Heracleum sosnowskyi]|uniref:Uncharacterized protein n=1 Tax=Heracleum sosnowskyi TaxID=360622 RepID=A0AAD8H424_9APIA|nr:hypothetical protein POM88_044543 [Heracleum sosnowskyi]